MKTCFLKINFKKINLLSKIKYSIFVNITFNSKLYEIVPLLFFTTVFFLMKQFIFLTKFENKSIKFLVIDLDTFKIKNLTFK